MKSILYFDFKVRLEIKVRFLYAPNNKIDIKNITITEQHIYEKNYLYMYTNCTKSKYD